MTDKTAVEMIRADCVIPAPMMSETERQKIVKKHRLGVWARGCIIEKEWRVHNPAFDKKGEKTTTMMRIRPAMSVDELLLDIHEKEKKEDLKA